MRVLLKIVSALVCVLACAVGTQAKTCGAEEGGSCVFGNGNMQEIERREDISWEEFRKEYYYKHKPVIVSGSSKALFPYTTWNISRLAEECGAMDMSTGFMNHQQLWSVIKKGKIEGSYLEMMEAKLGKYGTSWAELVEQFADGMTLAKYLEHMSEYKEGAGVGKTWKDGPIDYLVPFNVQNLNIESKCGAMADEMWMPTVVKGYAIQKWIETYGREMGLDEPTEEHLEELEFYGTKLAELVMAPAHSRAHPLHRHGNMNENFMYMLEGRKRFYMYHYEQASKLCKIDRSFIKTGENENDGQFAIIDDYFSADPHDEGGAGAACKGAEHAVGYEGTAGPGDLLFIPCNTVHLVHNLDDVLAVVFHVMQDAPSCAMGQEESAKIDGWVPWKTLKEPDRY